MAKDRYITLAGTSYRVEFGLQEREDIETASGAPIKACLAYPGTVKNLTVAVWGALKRNTPGLTAESVLAILQAHLESGGDVEKTMQEVRFLAMESRIMGVYKDADLKDIEARLYGEPAAAITPQ